MDHYCKDIKNSLDSNKVEEQQPVQIVRLWEETWECKKLSPQGDAILEAQQTVKYQGLKFYDIDSDDSKVMTVHRMVFRKERGQNTYDIFAIMPGFNVELPDDSPENDVFWQPWEVNEDLFDCLGAYYQGRITSRHKTLGRDVIVILSRLYVIITASTQFLQVLIRLEIPLVSSFCYAAIVYIGSPYNKNHV